MTKEEAINMLYGMRADNLNLDDLYTRDKYEALNMAIDALEQDTVAEVIPTEGKPCDDFLSREERLKMLMETGEFDFLKDIPPDKIWKLVFMLEFIGDAESEG